ncbi:MAG: addiction module protein [Verrucomicrobiia bacterium]|jgi:putative addiction module component (TIGR02574 family)
MSTTAQKICIEALSLPRQSRTEIAERILASLEDKADSKAEKAWKAVIRRRRGEIHSGKAKVRPAEDVMRDALHAIA